MTTNKDFQQTSDEYDLNASFFKWLFESNNIKLYYENDPIPLVEKSLIYYPQEMKNFFETFPMQRLKRILQLGTFIDNNSNALHTRYEHSIGVYNLKKQIILQQFLNNPEFVQYVEENNLKLNLIAELIKSAAHDIGHLPLSHCLELSVIQKRGFHEKIGKRILLENKQIYSCLYNISPNLPQALKDTLEHNYFGFKFLDEGSYDIDRFDYLYRDLAFNGYPINKKFEPFKLQKVKYENHTFQKDEFGRITASDGTDKNSIFVPVFDISSIDAIEEFLNLRIKAYKDSYINPITSIRSKALSIVLNKALESNEPNGANFQKFLTSLKSIQSSEYVDLDEWLSWNDLNFYNELLDIAEFSPNKALQKAAIFTVPGLEQLFDISVKMLGLKNPENKLSLEDKNFLRRLHRYLHEKNEFTAALSDFNYWNKCIKYTSDPQKIKRLSANSSIPVEFYSDTVAGYNPKEPIFFKTEDGQIYTYDSVPSRIPKIDSTKQSINVAFCFLPFLDEKNQPINELNTTLNENKPTSFGIPFFNRPSPAGMYIEKNIDKIDVER